MSKNQNGSAHLLVIAVIGLFLVGAALNVFGLRDAFNAFNNSTVLSSQAATLPLPANDRAKGLIYDGLEVDEANGKCKGLFKIETRDPENPALTRTFCTHGPDPAPEGTDLTQTAAAPSGEQVIAAAGSVSCEGDGVSGNRYHVLYVRASDKADRYSQYLSSFKTWSAGVNSVLQNSAAKTGGTRELRFVTDSNCDPVVENVVLSAAGDDNLNNTINELQSQGYGRGDRKYIMFRDANVYCGQGTVHSDDQPGPSNGNNFGPDYAIVDAGCWNTSLVAHEVGHNLGAVQRSAPHMTNGMHCTDDYDRMCYNDGTGGNFQILCSGTSNEQMFDCNNDDYFHTNPAVGSYLDTHWNIANNVFLIGAGSPNPSTLPSPSPTSNPTPSPSPSPTPNDPTPPTVQLTQPTNGAIVARLSTIVMAATASDNVAVTKVEFLVNNSITCTDTTSAYTCNWKVPGKKNGKYTLTAKAYDAAGNTTVSSVQVTSN